MEPILRLASDSLTFELNEDCSGRIVDRVNGTAWTMGPIAFQDRSPIAVDTVWNRRERVWADYFIGRFRAERREDGVLIRLLAPPWQETCATFMARWSIEERSLLLRVEGIDEKLPSLTFPPPIRCESVVLPSDVGKWLRNEAPGMSCEFGTQNGGLNMRWAGGLAADERAGWMMIFEDQYADSGIYRSGPAISPCWLKTVGRWAPTRAVRTCFTDDGYVGMAKTFRRWALERKLFRTLDEKMDQTPRLRDLVGGRTVSMFQCSTEHTANRENFFQPVTEADRARDGKLDVRITHADAAEIIRLAREWGMQRGIFNLRGTFKGGYDEMHPDIWPPEPALGSIDELHAIVNQEGPYLVVLHDNYQDMYPRAPSFPNDLVRTLSGNMLWGGHWHGGLCFITCSKKQIDYARRNWQDLSSLNLQGHFIDTATCVQFYECTDPNHPMTRTEDGRAKLELMQFFKDQGLVLGSEEAADYGLYHIDFLENRHSPQGTSGGRPARQLENYLWGYMSYWPANDLASWKREEEAFRQSLDLDAFHARVATAEMTTHRYLDDGLVEQTEFASGQSVIANFAPEPRTAEGHTIPSEGHVVLD